MSQRVHITHQFVERRPLEAAFKALGWKVVNDYAARTYRNRHSLEKHPLVAINPVDFVDLIITHANNQYTIGADVDTDYADSIFSTLGGRDFSKLKKQYSLEAIRQQAIDFGGDITEIVELEDGSLEVEVYV